MRIPRLFLDAPLVPGADVALPPQAAVHAVRVLRIGAGDALTLFNGDGHDYPATLTAATGGRAVARVGARRPSSLESPLRVTLAQALARGEKMDWIVQKATELGVTAILPLVTERSEVKLDDARAGKRVAHWRAIAIAACEQSGRSSVPAVAAPQPLGDWLRAMDAQPRATQLALHPTGGATPRTLAPPPSAVTLAVGPEGGFGERDLAALQAAGFGALTLGPRILRTETAGLAAIAALQALYGDL